MDTLTKGDETRRLILQRAFEASAKLGLEGLTIGGLAAALKMSKSGVHAHFGTKEALQLQVVDYAAEDFMLRVIKPALCGARDNPSRMSAMFRNWLALCSNRQGNVSGFFASAAAEFDDRAGPLRDRVLASQTRWMNFIADTFRDGVSSGEFRADFDPQQFAFDMYGIILAFHHAARMLGDSAAEQRAHEAFDRLMRSARVPPQTP